MEKYFNVFLNFFYGWKISRICILFFSLGGRGEKCYEILFYFSHMFFFGGTYIVVELGYGGLLIPLFLYFGFGY